MKYFKITRTWAVKVPDEQGEQDALKLIADNPDKYLDSETITRTEYKQKQPQTGWGQAVKEQIFGYLSHLPGTISSLVGAAECSRC